MRQDKLKEYRALKLIELYQIEDYCLDPASGYYTLKEVRLVIKEKLKELDEHIKKSDMKRSKEIFMEQREKEMKREDYDELAIEEVESGEYQYRIENGI